MHNPQPHWLIRTYARAYFWLAERLYHELAWIYDPVSWLVSLGQWDTWRKWTLEEVVGTRVLEIGFGTGELLLEMSRRGLSVTGMDPSAAMQRQTAAKLRRYGLSAPRLRGVSQRMPFASHSFDTILSTFPAGYINDPQTWCESARLLRLPDPAAGVSGGRFVVVGICAAATGKRGLPATWALFGQSMDEVLAHFMGLARRAGLEPRIVRRQNAGVEMPILIAETTS